MAYKDIQKRRDAAKAYKLKNSEKIKEQRKKWDKKYKSKPEVRERIKETLSKIYVLNKEYRIKSVREWQSKNKEKVITTRQVYRHKRKANLKGSKNALTREEWKDIKDKFSFCLSCKKTEPEIKLTLDHIIPLSKGGSHSKENVQPLCMKCNLNKFTKTINFLSLQASAH